MTTERQAEAERNDVLEYLRWYRDIGPAEDRPGIEFIIDALRHGVHVGWSKRRTCQYRLETEPSQF